MTRNAVVVVGSCNIDLVVQARRLPGPGETVHGSGFSTLFGGKGANQAVAASRAGAPTRMVASVGADSFGVECVANLRANGVDVTHVGVCKHDPTGVALIEVDDAGENRIVVVSGANAKLRSEHVDDAKAGRLFADAAVVLLQLEIPVAVVEHAARVAGVAGCRVVLNAAPVPPGESLDELLGMVHILLVNEHELALLGGLAALLQRVPMVVTTLGAHGAHVATSTGSTSIGVHRVRVVDTTGAGDAFSGAFAAALAAGCEADAAVERANAAGALATTALGAQPAMPSAAEIDALLAGSL